MRDRRDMCQVATDTKVSAILKDLRPPSRVSISFGMVDHLCGCGARFVGPPNAKRCAACRPAAAKAQQKKRLEKEKRAREAAK